MPIVKTHLLKEGTAIPNSQQVYNGLDCCLTYEVFEAISRLTNGEPAIYNFERALQAPILEIMLRGWRIDGYERHVSIKKLRSRIDQIDNCLQEFAFAVWGKGLNPRSSKQLQEFFYGTMKLPEQWTSQKGVKKLSMNRETFEKLSIYFHARPIISCILAIREYSKQLEVFETQVSSDGRMRTSYNIAGTETGRLSSSSAADWTGRNLQNIEDELRKMFISDEGWKICHIDLEQAESRETGFTLGKLFDDWTYLDACEGGDLHTSTCKLIWRDLPWTGDPKGDRAAADLPCYRHWSHRDMAKRGGHGTTYYGTPFTMARHLKVPVKFMEQFQQSFFSAYPAISKWHRWVAQQLQQTQYIETLFGRGRHFFGRPNDDTTLREAIAFGPQGSTADRTNLGLWRIWKHMPEVQLLGQGHDAIDFQFREDADEAAIVAKALELMRIELEHKGRKFVVPGEAKTGWNWSSYACGKCAKCKKAEKSNPNGLKKFKGSDERTRISGLDRIM
jgi:DNA polymerase I